MIFKNLDPNYPILTDSDWYRHSPPKGKLNHWVPGRSAMETALLWLKGLPTPFLTIVQQFNLSRFEVAPEYVTTFDSYGGTGRNHDLFILAKDAEGMGIAISIESKVDEPFGNTVGQYWATIQFKKEKKIFTNADKRIFDLFAKLLPGKQHTQFPEFRYQLITGIAGALAEAEKQGTDKAVFLIQTFVQFVNPKKHAANQKDLDIFIAAFSKGSITKLQMGILEGPFLITWNTKTIELWIGKYEV